MIRSVDRRLVRLVVIGAVAAVVLAGCGRKGPLDPPPSGAMSSSQPVNPPPSLGEQPNPFGAAAPGETPASAPPPANAARPAAEKKTFPLDWLIN